MGRTAEGFTCTRYVRYLLRPAKTFLRAKQDSGTQSTSSPTEFKQRALEEYRALHAPLNLDPHITHPRGSLVPQFIPDSPTDTPEPARTPLTSASKQLYLIPPALEPTPFPPLLLLHCPHPSCPTPHPSTTLQGLLNHTRIAHGPGYAFASHDEFIGSPGATTVLDAALEPERYVRVRAEGVRVSAGGVRGLNALFESALGGGERKESVNLGLGLHAETPALAGLFGRKVRKGEIRAFGEDEEVNVEQVEESTVSGERWKRYGVWAPKRGARPEVDVTMDEVETVESSRRDPGESSPPALSVVATVVPLLSNTQSSSRFHVKKRVVVSDWSQSLRRGKLIWGRIN
jgi:hypothetical protein